jgi:hypothetical protein
MAARIGQASRNVNAEIKFGPCPLIFAASCLQ